MRAVLFALGLSLVSGLFSAAAQDKEIRLKFSSWVPPAHPLNPALIE